MEDLSAIKLLCLKSQPQLLRVSTRVFHCSFHVCEGAALCCYHVREVSVL